MRRIPVPLATAMMITLLLGMMAAFTQVGYANADLSPSIQEETPPPPANETPQTTSAATPELYATPTPTSTSLISSGEDLEDYSSRELFFIDGPITEWISDIAARHGLDSIYFLGLSVEDWINLAVSILFFLGIYYIGRWLLLRVLKQLLKRTPIEADVELLDLLKPQINWFVITIGLQFSLARLNFLGIDLRVLLNQAFFIAYLTFS